ncbi:MAG: sterol desaturase family protein [Anaerolineae bacterium]|nr:sterol desaturase family protein [Anaerolineae bacterium]MCB1422027.1 sterol desaturase family protein [Nitratireductor sp.]
MNTAVIQDPKRDEREIERQKRFRKKFVEETPPWYHGVIHLSSMLAITFGTMWYCIQGLDNPTFWEWMLIPFIALFGNWVEWAAHRYVLHRPVKGLEMVYKRHCTVHHQFFTHHDLGYSGHKEWRALLFPLFAPVAFILASLPAALLAGWLFSANAGYMIVLTMTGYYLLYEGLHTLSHLDDERHPYLKYIPLVNTVRRMHYIHHVLGYMQTKNFNLTFPICDYLFGTSDLDRGFLGTMFNGSSHDHMRRELRPEDPGIEIPGIDTPAPGASQKK